MSEKKTYTFDEVKEILRVTQVELAKLLGVKESYITQWKKGKFTPSDKIFYKIENLINNNNQEKITQNITIPKSEYEALVEIKGELKFAKELISNYFSKLFEILS
jgi:transcriptional regulator with XRE-family HTH domain